MAMHTAPVSPALDIEIDWTRDAEDEPTLETTVDSRILAEATGDLPVSTFGAPVMAPQEARDLIASERSVLANAGIDTSDDGLLFEAGTALAESGLQALKGYEAAFRAIPPPATVLGDFEALIASEDRQDHERDLVGMRLTTSGRLAGESMIADPSAGLDLGLCAWRQLAEIAGGQNINAGLASRTRAPRRIRTRLTEEGGTRREAFGIVSTDPTRGYAVFDGPQVADLMMSALRDRGLLSGAKLTIDYDRETTKYDIRAVVQAPVDVPAFAGVGRVHQLFARVTGGDDGNHAVRGGLGALRIRCLNATLVEANGTQWTKTHRGQASEIRQLVRGMVDAFGTASESLKEVWSRAAANHYLNTDGSALSVQEALTRLVMHGHIPAGGLDKEDAVDAYMAAWRAEDSPTSAAGVMMAVQRAAHETTWSTKWARAEIEESASALLYQPVWQLAEVEA